MSDARSVIVTLMANVKQYEASMAAAARSTAAVGDAGLAAGAKSGAGFAKLNKMSALAGGAVLAIGAVSVKMAADFQTSMTHLVTGAGESESAIKGISDAILNMAGDLATSPEDLASGMYMISSAGIHGAAGLEVLRIAAEGAKVGAADLGDTADAVTTALNAWQLPASDAASVMDQLIATMKNGKTHMPDLVNSLGAIAPIAAALHVPLSQVGGAMATMTGQGTDASKAAQSLRFLLGALAKPTDQATTALEAIHLTSKKLNNTIGREGLGAGLELLQTRLHKAYGSGPEYVAALSAVVGGTRGMTAALELSGPHLETYRANIEKIAEAGKNAGHDVEGWKLEQEDMNHKLESFGASMQAAGIRLGNAFLPAATDIMDKLSGMAEWLSKNEWAAKSLVGVLSAFAAVKVASVFADIAKSAISAGAAMVGWVAKISGAGAATALLEAQTAVQAELAVSAQAAAVAEGELAVANQGVAVSAGEATAALGAEGAAGGVGALGSGAAGATGALGGLTLGMAAAGVAGAALLAAGLAYRNANLHASGTEGVTSAIEANTGAVNDNIRSQTLAAAQSNGMVDAAKRVGVSQDDLVSAILAGGPAWDSLKTKMNDYKASEDNAAASSGARFRTGMSADADVYGLRLDDMRDKVLQATTAGKSLGDQFHATGADFTAAGVTVDEVTKAVDGDADAIASITSKLAAFRQAQASVTAGGLDWLNNQAQMKQGMAALGEQIRASGGDFRTATAAGQANIAMVTQMAAAAARWRDSQAAANVPTADVDYGRQIRALENLVPKYGAAGKAMRAALEASIPPEVRVKLDAEIGPLRAKTAQGKSLLAELNAHKANPKIAADISPAQKATQQIQHQIDRVKQGKAPDMAVIDAATTVLQGIQDHIAALRDKTVTVTYVANSAGTGNVLGPPQSAGGHLASGGFMRGAGSTTSDSIPAMLSDREFVENADAVDYYGEDFMSALNEKRIPRDRLRYRYGGIARFKGGGKLTSAQKQWKSDQQQAFDAWRSSQADTVKSFSSGWNPQMYDPAAVQSDIDSATKSQTQAVKDQTAAQNDLFEAKRKVAAAKPADKAEAIKALADAQARYTDAVTATATANDDLAKAKAKTETPDQTRARLVREFTDYKNKALKYAQNLRILKSRGLGGALIADIVGRGFDAGSALADALVSGGISGADAQGMAGALTEISGDANVIAVASDAADLAAPIAAVYGTVAKPKKPPKKKHPGKAGGGTVLAGHAYTVNEEGLETFVPGVTGTIVPAAAGTGMSYSAASQNVTVSGPLILELEGEQVWRGQIKYHKRTGFTAEGAKALRP